MSQETKRHYYLVSAMAVFRVQEEGQEEPSDMISTISMNTVLPTEKAFVTAADLGNAQRNIQLQLHRQMEGVIVHVLDVVINALSYMGEMTKEEFYGPGVQEKDKGANGTRPELALLQGSQKDTLNA